MMKKKKKNLKSYSLLSQMKQNDGRLSKIDTEHEKAMVDELLNTLIETTKMNYLNKE